MSTDALIRSFDASSPPSRPVPGCGAVLGYIGGRTPHVWTAAEWNAASSGGQLYQAPIWVADLGQSPAGSARDAAAVATARGWTPHHEPVWRAIIADMEAQLDEPWLAAFGNQLQAEGFLCFPYMSQVALPSDPPGYTVWLATFDELAEVPPIHDVIANQYKPNVPFDGTAVDLSVWSPAAMASFGRGPRR